MALGLLVIQKDTAAWALTLARGATGQGLLRLSRFGDAGPEPIAEAPFAGTMPFLRVSGQDLAYTFEFSADGRRWTRIGPALDGTQLSPAVLKGFNYTGVFVGLYASSNGRPTQAHADFSRFRYDADAPPPGR